MRAVEANQLIYYQFDHLTQCKGLHHGVFTRMGGHSEPPFAGLNVSHGLGDDPDKVKRNRHLILQSTGGDAMAFLQQNHGNRVIMADHRSWDDAGRSASPRADALVASKTGLMMGIQVADCQPILLYDPRQHIVANVHAGWRGSVADIPGCTVAAMASEFGCRPEDILAGIGPSLGPCCAEFYNYRSELPESFWPYKDHRDHFNFWQITVDQLCAAGLSQKNIEVGGICTRCRTDRFFSYRAEKTTGRFAAVIGLASTNPTQ